MKKQLATKLEVGSIYAATESLCEMRIANGHQPNNYQRLQFVDQVKYCGVYRFRFKDLTLSNNLVYFDCDAINKPGTNSYLFFHLF